MLTLKGRFKQKIVEPELGKSLLDIAVKHSLDWNYSCTRGTCARCRCFVQQGQDHLVKPTQAEIERLDEDELAEGYRLGCQAKLQSIGEITAYNKPYF